MSRQVVFVGPSGSLISMESYPTLSFLPPVKAGDLLSLVKEQSVDHCLVIDGVFGMHQCLTISEIRTAIELGTGVYGSASIGALRAVECRSIGMVGLGVIYRQLLRSDIVRDSDLSLVYLSDFTSLTVPLVNVKYLIQSFQRDQRCALYGWYDAVSRVFFEERTMFTLRALAKDLVSDRTTRDALLSRLTDEDSHTWDIKAKDAQASVAMFERLCTDSVPYVEDTTGHVPSNASSLLAQRPGDEIGIP